MTPAEMVTAFVDRINAHDVDGVCALMEWDHVFIDALGRSVTGREAMRSAWKSYFAMVPDYWIRVDRVFQQGSIVGVFGKAGGTFSDTGRLDAANRWEVPAAWQAVVGDKGITEWQVFADNEPIRQIMSRVARNETAP
jgi:ketosteroid isomerase-like protein